MRKRGTVQRSGLEALVKKKSRQVRETWGRHRGLMRFLEDYFPHEWEDIRHCSLSYKALEEAASPGWYKVAPLNVCHRIPYCIQCTKVNTQRRIRNAFNQFARATPAGRRPRFIHVVQTAPATDDGQGWGWPASRNIRAFGRIVWDALGDLYGPGLGAIMSYQDFGEQAFAKRHPHMDLTLNGYMLHDGTSTLTPRYDLSAGGLQRWDACVMRRATRLQIDASRGNVWLGHAVVGVPAYYAQLKYQMRELVDLRKLDYTRNANRVDWLSYKDNHRTQFTVDAFLDGLMEYQMRLRVWNRGERQQLHRAYGTMAKNTIGTTQRLVDGSDLPHDAHCPCGECGDWHRVFLDDVGDTQAPPLKPC